MYVPEEVDESDDDLRRRLEKLWPAVRRRLGYPAPKRPMRDLAKFDELVRLATIDSHETLGVAFSLYRSTLVATKQRREAHPATST